MTDNLGQSQVIPYLKGLSSRGVEITLMSFEKKENFQNRKNVIQDLLNKNNINWHPLKYTASPPVLSTVKDIIIMIKESKKIYLKQNFTIVHCRSYISAFAGLYLKRNYGVKFLFDMRGFWPDERVEGGIWNLKNPVFNFVYRYFKKKEKRFLTSADYIVSLTENGKRSMQSWSYLKNANKNIEVIPCCADFNHFKNSFNQQEKTRELKKQLNMSDNDFVLSYLGSIGTWYMLDEMLDFFKVLLSKKGNAKFLFITAETPGYILSKAVEKSIDTSKIIVKKSNREDVPTYIALSSVSIFFIKPVFSKRASSPTKMAEIMGMGIPVICNGGVGDVDMLIKNTRAGVLINNFTTKEYLKVIDNLSKLNITPEQIREIAIQLFSLEKGVAKYANIYKKL
jgi:glycosyltransferase involved in cell wall biosynthesis